jgi:hypothetical protein
MEKGGVFAPLVVATLGVAALATLIVDDGWRLWVPALLAVATACWLRTVLDQSS